MVSKQMLDHPLNFDPSLTYQFLLAYRRKKHYFAKLIKAFKVSEFSLKRDPFRLHVNLNLNKNLKILLTTFAKFSAF